MTVSSGYKFIVENSFFSMLLAFQQLACEITISGSCPCTSPTQTKDGYLLLQSTLFHLFHITLECFRHIQGSSAEYRHFVIQLDFHPIVCVAKGFPAAEVLLHGQQDLRDDQGCSADRDSVCVSALLHSPLVAHYANSHRAGKCEEQVGQEPTLPMTWPR